MPNDFLDSTHPVWDQYHEEWARRERLLRGGAEVIEGELARFDWEEPTGDSYAQRKREAVYPGFGETYVRTIVGHVLKERPDADGALQMGTMGKIQRGDGESVPSEAELVFYNVNGTGGDGMQWWQWLSGVFQRAGATGLRWVLVEAPPFLGAAEGRTPTAQDVLAGQRPYAVEFSPRVVTNWWTERGTLQACVIRIRSDTRRMVDGTLQGSAAEAGYYLLVRQGFEALGSEYAGGGWWKFDEKRERVEGAAGHGTWAKTGGEIPMSLAVWEWEDPGGDATDAENQPIPLPLARGATAALDNLSVAYMNAVSAWRNNAWRSAGGPTFLLGVDTQSWTIAQDQWRSGTSLMGVPAADGGKGATPSVEFSGAAAVSAEAYKALLEHMTDEAERMMVEEATSAPDSSGRSKEAGFTESKAPRLVLLAENMESFQNTILRFFEMRFGHNQPSAYVEMPRQFDLAPVEEDIREFFETFRQTNLRSATLETDAMVRLAESKGLVSDDNRATVEAELRESVTAEATALAQARQGQQEIRDALLRGRAGQAEEGGAA